MWADLLLQAAVILSTLFMFLYTQNIPQKFLSKLRFRNRADFESKRHFIKGAEFLSQAKSAKDRSSISSSAKSAEIEADLAIASNPKDAAAYILKALALELRGSKTSALDALDGALSPELRKSLSGDERGDALYKRAALKLDVGRRGRVDSAIDDLVESVRLKGDNEKAFYLLGECYRKKGMNEEAKRTFEDALNIQPNYTLARQALDQLLCS